MLLCMIEPTLARIHARRSEGRKSQRLRGGTSKRRMDVSRRTACPTPRHVNATPAVARDIHKRPIRARHPGQLRSRQNQGSAWPRALTTELPTVCAARRATARTGGVASLRPSGTRKSMGSVLFLRVLPRPAISALQNAVKRRFSGLLCHDHRCPFGSVFEEWSRHSFRQANASVRRGIRWDVTFVHCVAAVEMHAIGHSRSIEMRASRPAVFACVNVRLHDVTILIDVIAEFTRDVVPVFRDNAIVARWGGETRLAGRDGRLPNHMFTFVEVSHLFANTDDDLGRAGGAFIIPPTRRRTGRIAGCISLFDVRRDFFTAGAENNN